MNFASFFAKPSVRSATKQDHPLMCRDSASSDVSKLGEREIGVPEPARSAPYDAELGMISRQLDGVFLVFSSKYEKEVKLIMADIPCEIPYLVKLKIAQWIRFTSEVRNGDYFVTGFCLTEAPYVTLPLSNGSIAVQCKIKVPFDGNEGLNITSEVSSGVYDKHGLIKERHWGQEVSGTVVYSPKENSWIIEFVN